MTREVEGGPAEPVYITNPEDIKSTGGGGGGAVTNVGVFAVQETGTVATTIGAVGDAAVTTDASGSLSAKLRGIIKLLVDKITVKLDAGTNLVGKVGIDQSTANANEVVIKSGTLTTITNVVDVSGEAITIAQTPTITAGAYAAKDAVGGKLTFANAVRASGGKSLINSLVIVDLSVAAAGLELWLFDRDFTATADNAAFDPSDADLANCVGVIPISSADYYVANDNEVACISAIGLQYQLNATSLYGQLKCTGTPTFASTGDLTVKLAVQYLD